jgi:hypothetical protein
MTQLIEECSASGTTADWNDESTSDFDLKQLARDWRGFRKGRLRITSDVVEFEDWTIACKDIDSAVLTLVQGMSPGYLLRIKASGKPYQFSIPGGEHFKGELPFPVRRESTVGITWPKLLLRILLGLVATALVAYWLSRR